ncbi:MAG: hypothetical protein HQK53_12350 [Oligoflexia bacterium]|nr:hypothetical protein [Oligoflexia bacterium]
MNRRGDGLIEGLVWMTALTIWSVFILEIYGRYRSYYQREGAVVIEHCRSGDNKECGNYVRMRILNGDYTN